MLFDVILLLETFIVCIQMHHRVRQLATKVHFNLSDLLYRFSFAITGSDMVVGHWLLSCLWAYSGKDVSCLLHIQQP